MTSLTKTINEEFKKNFTIDIIRYQLKKLNNDEYGHLTEDAEYLVKLLKDNLKRSSYFGNLLSEDGKLRNVCFMSPRMKDLTLAFDDVLFIDMTHKSNRFGLPLLDIILVNNHGRSCTCFLLYWKIKRQIVSFGP